MSGIYGYYLRNGELSEPYKRALACWNSSYGSRTLCLEPNGQQFFGACLDHLSAKVPEQSQPLDTPKYTAVIDALIYNRAELAEKYGLDVSGLSDEELLFRILTEHGPSALAGVNGDFAGLLYDKEAHSYTLFRDHMGIRPLFYYLDEDRFVFSTDMRAFLAIPDLSLSINGTFLYKKLTDKLVTNVDDFDFKEIHMVRYASWVTIRCGDHGPQISPPTKYWTIGQNKIRLKNEKAYQAKMRSLIEEAVQRRMDAVDGLIGAELSGGLDSSVLSILTHRLGREGRYFSWSAPPEVLPIIRPDDERNIVDSVCRQEGFSVQYNTDELDFSIPAVFDRLFPPYANTSTISEASNYFQSQGVRAVFTGHGGDEGVSHRCNLYELYYHKEYWHYFLALYRMREGRKLRLLRTARAFVKDALAFRKKSPVTIGSEAIVLSDFLNPDYVTKIRETTSEHSFTFGYDALQYLAEGYHTNRPMNTAFQATRYGVRYLFPYLDYQVIDYAVSIPRWLYNNGVQKRRIYIEAFRDLLPETLLKYFAKRTVSTERGSGESMDCKERIAVTNQRIQTLVSRLDPDLWSPYLDMEKLKAYKIPENATNNDITLAYYSMDYIFYCVNLQNTWQHAIDPVMETDSV